MRWDGPRRRFKGWLGEWRGAHAGRGDGWMGRDVTVRVWGDGVGIVYDRRGLVERSCVITLLVCVLCLYCRIFLGDISSLLCLYN